MIEHTSSLMAPPKGVRCAMIKTCQIVVSGTGVIVHCDLNCAEKIGLPRQHLIQRPLREVLLELNPLWESLLPDDLCVDTQSLFLPWQNEGKSSSRGLDMNCIKHNNMLYVALSPSLAPYEQLRMSSLLDIEPSQAVVAQMYLRLQTAESRLHNYMHHFPGIFFSQRPDLSFSFIGPNFESTIGQPSGPLNKNGNYFLDLIHEQDREYYLDEIDSHSKSSKTFSFNFRIRHPAAEHILYLLEVRTPQLSPAGLLLGYEGVWLDITRQAIAESRLTSTTWKESLATLTSGLVHDFSNIMAGIYSLSELYHESMDQDHPWYQGMSQIKKNSREAQELVRRIIELNRESANQRSIQDIESLIKEQLHLFKIILPKFSNLKTCFTDQELPVYIDDVGFRQVLLNFAMNSRDACGDTSEVTIEVRRVQQGEKILEYAHEGCCNAVSEGVEIQISDNGQGISEQHLKMIFEPFFTTKETHKGSGFGLYNAQLFVKSMNGLLGVNSNPGSGTAFTMYLPLADFSEIEIPDETPEEESFYFKGRPNFLVYAAKDPSGFDIVSLLQEKEWETITFCDEERIYQYLEEAEYFPHVLLIYCLGIDPQAQSILNSVSTRYPFIKIVLLATGCNPDDLTEDVRQQADLVLYDGLSHQTVMSKISALLT